MMKLGFKIFGLLVILLIAGVGIKYYPFDKDNSHAQPDENCPEVVNKSYYGGFGGDLTFISCHGILVQEKDLDYGTFQIFDHKNEYPVVVLNDKDNFRVVNGRLFALQAQEPSENKIRYDDQTQEYFAYYFIGGSTKKVTFKTLEDVPKYLAVDINSGEVTLFKNDLSDANDNERRTFSDLEKTIR